MSVQPTFFESHAIRRVYDEDAEAWWFSVVDIMQVLTQQPDYQTARKYWNKLKERLGKEGSQSVTDCHRLKLPAADGKNYLTDVATAETLLRLERRRQVDGVPYRCHELPASSPTALQLHLPALGGTHAAVLTEHALTIRADAQHGLVGITVDHVFQRQLITLQHAPAGHRAVCAEALESQLDTLLHHLVTPALGVLPGTAQGKRCAA